MTNSNRINVFMGTALVILLYILFTDKCNVSPNEKPPVTVDKVREVIKLDTQRYATMRDSFTLLLNKRYAIDKENQENNNILMAENVQLYNDNEQLKIPKYADTCQQVVDFLNKKYTTYATQTQKTLSSSRTTISGLSNTISSQKSALSKKDALYNQLRKDSDTCLSVAKKWEDYSKKNKQRSFIYAGIAFIGEKNNIFNGYGGEIGFTNRKGTSFGIQAININSQLNYGITIRTKLIKLW